MGVRPPAWVPTAAERNGDFSAWLQGSSPQIIYNPYDAAGNIVDPSLRQPFAGNIIPQQYSPAPSTALLKYIPLPNIANAAPGINNYSGMGMTISMGMPPTSASTTSKARSLHCSNVTPSPNS